MSSARQHTGSPSKTPPVPEPAHSERARTLLALERVGSLSTQSRKQPGYPFGSIMPYALDESGRPIFLISTMAMHTQNLLADSRASLLVSQSVNEGDPLGASRVTLVGDIFPVAEPERLAVRSIYLGRHENAQYWVDFRDFAFYRMEVVDLYFVGGFGVMGWVAADEYQHAQVDPLSDFAAGIIEHMNADHADSLLLLSKTFAGIDAEEAQMTAVDRLGFHLRLKTSEGMRGTRIGFPREATTSAETRKVFIEMVQQARAR